jgi:dihydrofolate synthase/folylpolyglutamate synthase
LQIDAINLIEGSKILGSRLGLERISRLCALLGNPQDAVPAVHVSGTNGKGSICAMVASVLTAAGYKNGLYTSPYILDVCECMQIGGVHITREEFTSLACRIKEPAARMAEEGDPPTEFELETAMAFLWFKESCCDVSVIEVGLGGRLDATNVLKQPLASVIASISLDHMAILGNTLGEIAQEKCGILKPGGVAVSYPKQPPEALRVIGEKAKDAGNALIIPEAGNIHALGSSLDGTDIEYAGLRLHIPLIGTHQLYNAATAVETVLALRERGFRISGGSIEKGIRSARMPLRQEAVCRNPIVLLDGAHNPDGLAALAETMKSLILPRRTAVVMGMLADKEYQKAITLIAPLCGRFIAVAPASPRALPAESAAACARPYCADVTAQDDYGLALTDALAYAGGEGAVVVCGSLYLAGPMRKVYFEKFMDGELLEES